MNGQLDVVVAELPGTLFALTQVRRRAWPETLGKLLWEAFHISGGGGKNGTRDVLVPPPEKFFRCFLCLWGRVCLEKVNDELGEFLVIKPIIVAHPMGSVHEGKVNLGGVSWVEKQREPHTCAAAYAIARGVTHPSILCIFALFARLGGPVPVDLRPPS